VQAWPWTTGKVRVLAYGDYANAAESLFYFPEILSRIGYDNRTSYGGGTVKLVTPHLTNWTSGSYSYSYAAIGVLRLEFIPEPSSGIALLAGAGLLGVLHWQRKRW